MVAEWVPFNVIDTERQDWARGRAALRRYTEREGHARVPYEHKEGATALGQWVAEQRRAYEAGQMNGLARLEDGTDVKLGVFVSNNRSRRAKFTIDRLAALAALGLDWAMSGGSRGYVSLSNYFCTYPCCRPEHSLTRQNTRRFCGSSRRALHGLGRRADRSRRRRNPAGSRAGGWTGSVAGRGRT
ncbi:helicase associated domain-containing protein [Streptomyces sp. NPDC059582]|uniref:helicase associated domain-containing protein n=1 Tax=Streptomyces sp. NPDC059582 TaxID=3346875 RepID=UPI0036C09BF5